MSINTLEDNPVILHKLSSAISPSMASSLVKSQNRVFIVGNFSFFNSAFPALGAAGFVANKPIAAFVTVQLPEGVNVGTQILFKLQINAIDMPTTIQQVYVYAGTNLCLSFQAEFTPGAPVVDVTPIISASPNFFQTNTHACSYTCTMIQ